MQNNFNEENKRLLYRTLYLVSILLLLIISIITVINIILYFNQKIYIINGFNKEAVIKLKSGKTINIEPYSREVLYLKEGKTELKIKLGEDEEYSDQFLISNKFWERFKTGRVQIYNIKGGALIVWEETEFVNKLMINNDREYKYSAKIYTGETFFKLKNIDFKFQEFPETINIDSGVSKIVNRIDVLNMPFDNQFYLFYYYPVEVDKAINYFNVHLEDNFKNETFLDLYYSFCVKNKYFEKTLQKIEPYLLNEPINIPIHRFYQNLYLEIDEKNRDELLKKYEGFIKKYPHNSNLLYLYGRLLNNYSSAKKYYEASILSNNDNPYPWHALSYLYFSYGDFVSAKKYSTKAISLDSDSQLFKSNFNEMSYANKEYDQLINETIVYLENDPVNYNYLLNLMELYLLNNDETTINEVIERYIEKYKETYKESDIDQIRLSILLNLNCYQGKFLEMVKMVEKLTNKDTLNFWQFILNIENGNLLEAEKNIDYKKDDFNGYDFLLLYLSCIIKGNTNKADIWLKDAVLYFEAGTKEDIRLAKLIEEKSNDDKDIIESINNLTIYPNYKRIVYLVMANLYPNKKNDLIRLAGKFNYNLSFPHYYINKTIQKL